MIILQTKSQPILFEGWWIVLIFGVGIWLITILLLWCARASRRSKNRYTYPKPPISNNLNDEEKDFIDKYFKEMK